MDLIKGKAGGFFTPQDEGGKCKLTIIFEDRAAQDAAFLMRYKDVVIGLASERSEAHQETGPTRLETLQGMQRFIDEEIRKEINNSGSNGITPAELDVSLLLVEAPE